MRLRSRQAFAAVAIVVGVAGVTAGTMLWPRPVKLVAPGAGENDTIVVNSRQPAGLVVSVVDQYGRKRPSDAAVHFRVVSGDVEVSPIGVTTCTRRGNAVVRATLNKLSRDFVLHCRPVAWLEAPSWMIFVVGDSARDLSFVAHGPDGAPVTELRGSVEMMDGSVAELTGINVRPGEPGMTMAFVTVGDMRTGITVLVHRLVTSFINHPRNQNMLAMRVRLARGDTMVVPLPKASFWVRYISASRSAAPPTIELQGNGSCTLGDGIHLKRLEEGEYARYCFADDGTSMMIAHGQVGADTVSGTVALELSWR